MKDPERREGKPTFTRVVQGSLGGRAPQPAEFPHAAAPAMPLQDERPAPRFVPPPLAPPPAAAAAAVTALFVAHGMGQQVQFETLDAVVTSLRGAHERNGVPAPSVAVRQIQMGTERVARAELTVSTPAGLQRELHIYEGYWAPLTEGQISLPETFRFLVTSGWNGALRALRGSWWRMMFGRPRTFQLGPRTAWAFAATIAVLASVGLMNAVIALAVASRVAGGGGGQGWPSGGLFTDLTADFAIVLAVVGALLWTGVVGVAKQRVVGEQGEVKAAALGATRFGWACVWAAVAVLVAGGAVVAWHLIVHFGQDAPSGWARVWHAVGLDRMRLPGRLAAAVAYVRVPVMVLVWILVAFASWLGRGFLLQYVGDVAIYVSSFTVNRFCETRERMQKATSRVLRFVYELPNHDGSGHAYNRVVVVGHSLGSVIAYDALNAMYRDDLNSEGALDVVGRTKLFVTFGSPLDKTAFIFRSQPHGTGDTREALAQSMQPMITDYRTRPPRWVNLYTPNDWICGDLGYYDDDARPKEDPQRVLNVLDKHATTPLLAHTEYWSGPTLGDVLYGEALADAALPKAAAGPLLPVF